MKRRMHPRFAAVLAGIAALSLGVPNTLALPLITNAVVTEGADAAELPPKFTGQTFDHPNEGAGFLVPSFGEDVPTFNDRNHEWNGAGTELPIPDYLLGGEYLMFPNDDRDNNPYQVVVTVTEEVDVYLLIDNRLADNVNTTPPNLDEFMLWVTEAGWQAVRNGLNRNADPEVPDEVGVDEAGDGVGPGVALNQWSSIYHRRVSAGTFTLGIAENAGRNMYGVVVTRVPGSTTSPPEIANVAPANNTLFYPAGSGLSFAARTVTPNSIAANNVKLLLNGVDVSANLTVAGTALARTATYGGLVPDTLYRAQLIAVDQVGRGTTNTIVFDTFASSALAVEAEDYNHGGGNFEANPGPGAYANLTGTRDTDYHNNNLTAPAANYRPDDYVSLVSAADVARPAFEGAGATDYQLNQLQAGDWFQYTRNFAAGVYQVYLRASTTAQQGVRLDRVASGVASPVGMFAVVPGNQAPFGYVPLTDAAGRSVTVSLSGAQTLRLTALAANVNLGLNYLLLVPAAAPASPAYASSAAPTPGATGVSPTAVVRVALANGSSPVTAASVALTFDGANVTSAATVTPSADGVLVTYDPPGDLALGRTYPVMVSFATGAGTSTAEWAFTTVSNLIVLPANFGTPTGSGQTAGFQLKMRKAPDFNASGVAYTLANTAARAEQQLADLLIDPDWAEPYINEAPGPSGDGRATTALINFDQLAASAGYFPNDAGFPHVDLGASPDPNNMAMEVTAYVEFPAGVHRLGVRSDDGFRVTTGPNVAEATLLLGQFEGGRGDGLPAGATEFVFQVETAGVYPIRLIWYEGNGGARLEFYSVDPETQVRTLINDTKPGSLKAFQTRSVVVNVPNVAITQPANGVRYPNSPTNVVLIADASVVGSTIAKVEFFANGTTKLGEATQAPYRLEWPSLQGGRYTVMARATDVRGLTRDSTNVSFQVGTPISVNFQAATAEVPEGYLADYGDIFDDRGNGYSYGWDDDNLAHARDRNDARSPDERYDTFNHMQKPPVSGTLWEIVVPNGRYNVFLVAGEAANIDSVFNIQAEGVTVTQGTPTDTVRFFEGQTAVNVTDGRLSVGNGPGAANNKICFIEIYSVPAETAVPVLAPPVVTAGNVTITWTNGGMLESAPSAAGPWTSTGDGDGSFTEPASAAAKFFRVRR